MFVPRLLQIAIEIWGAFFCMIASICLLCNQGIPAGKKRLLVYMELSTTLLLVMDSIAWIFRGRADMTGYVWVRISNFCVFFLSAVILLLVHAYVCENLFGRQKRGKRYPIRVRLVYGIGILEAFLVVLTQYTHLYYYFDSNNTYHRNTWYPVSLLLGLLAMLLDLTLLLQYRKRVKRGIVWSIVSYLVLPIAASVLLLFYYGVSLLNISIATSMICIFVAAMTEQGKELRDTRVELMLSQIQPHFIYNTLATIRYLCGHDPAQAIEVVDEFSVYLRGNIDSLTEKDGIPFQKELQHVQAYLAIEKKRFGDRVKVSCEIEETDFMVPPLMLQPIVENAVKHGICRKKEGGTIRIGTKKENGCYVIRVEDDGVGFDVKQKKNEEAHIGMDNVRNRIASMYHGTMLVESRIGKGTAVEIQLPVPEEGKIWKS